MSKAYFITGSSGAGKSTLVKELKKIIPDGYSVYDFDELGVPLDADGEWRRATTKKWIEVVRSDNARKLIPIVIGLVRPEEVADYADKETELHFLFLEVEKEELKRRLYAHRFSTPERIANLLKYENVSPEKFFDNNQDYIARLKKQVTDKNGMILDTTNLTPNEVCHKVLEWIR